MANDDPYQVGTRPKIYDVGTRLAVSYYYLACE